MKDAPAPAGVRCMRAARTASRGRPASRWPAGARRGGACRGGRADASTLAWGLAACGVADAEPPLLSPVLWGRVYGLYAARWRPRRRCAARRGEAYSGCLYKWRWAAGEYSEYRGLTPIPLPICSPHLIQACGERPTAGRGCGADAVVRSAWPDAGLEVVSGADVLAALPLQTLSLRRQTHRVCFEYSQQGAWSDACLP
jgi:hypothetical protein